MSDNSLGDRFKAYEQRMVDVVPHDEYMVIRIDGRAFHTYTRGFNSPFDLIMNEAMIVAAKATCQDIDGARMAYVQSDECSIVCKPAIEEHWFGGKNYKITSVAASVFTYHFNELIQRFKEDVGPAYFDARVFTIPTEEEVEEYFLWRFLDNKRNVINLIASEHYSHKQLMGKKTSERIEMIKEKGDSLDQYPDRFRYGVSVVKENYTADVEYFDPRVEEVRVIKDCVRTRWRPRPSLARASEALEV